MSKPSLAFSTIVYNVILLFVVDCLIQDSCPDGGDDLRYEGESSITDVLDTLYTLYQELILYLFTGFIPHADFVKYVKEQSKLGHS